MIEVDHEPIPTLTQALAELEAGRTADARKLIIYAATEMRVLTENRNRLEGTVAVMRDKLRRIGAIGLEPESP
jgi:uncharacterized protein involved in exopolysaccharide biosynthesis